MIWILIGVDASHINISNSNIYNFWRQSLWLLLTIQATKKYTGSYNTVVWLNLYTFL